MAESVDPQKTWDEFWGPVSPFHGELGAELVEADAETGRSIVRLPYRPGFDNAPDPEEAAIHGGVIASLVDLATGYSIALKTDGRGGPSVDIRVDYLAPARRTALTAHATVVKIGRNIGVADASIYADNGRLVASGRQTCFLGGSTKQ